MTVLMQATPMPSPGSPPTWENLIPWIVAFFAFLTSGVVWYVLKDIKDEIIDLQNKIEDKKENDAARAKAIESAIDRAARSNLMLVIALPQSTPAMKTEANAIGKEIDDATRSREQT